MPPLRRAIARGCRALARVLSAIVRRAILPRCPSPPFRVGLLNLIRGQSPPRRASLWTWPASRFTGAHATGQRRTRAAAPTAPLPSAALPYRFLDGLATIAATPPRCQPGLNNRAGGRDEGRSMVEAGVESQVGARIRELRQQRRLSVTELARRAEVSKRLVGQRPVSARRTQSTGSQAEALPVARRRQHPPEPLDWRDNAGHGFQGQGRSAREAVLRRDSAHSFGERRSGVPATGDKSARARVGRAHHAAP